MRCWWFSNTILSSVSCVKSTSMANFSNRILMSGWNRQKTDIALTRVVLTRTQFELSKMCALSKLYLWCHHLFHPLPSPSKRADHLPIYPHMFPVHHHPFLFGSNSSTLLGAKGFHYISECTIFTAINIVYKVVNIVYSNSQR